MLCGAVAQKIHCIINNDLDFRQSGWWRVNADRLPDWINAQIDNRTGKAHNGINGDAVKSLLIKSQVKIENNCQRK